MYLVDLDQEEEVEVGNNSYQQYQDREECQGILETSYSKYLVFY